MNRITIWQRLNEETRKWGHNHIEDGHVVELQGNPTGDKYQTKAWDKGTWRWAHAYLENGRVV